MTEENFKEGKVLLIDKPLDWTSFQVVNKLRWEIKNKFSIKKIKVGHAGTLDPLATGLLVLCTGKYTKRIEEYQAKVKEYTGIIRLGGTTPSYDLETEIDKTFDISGVSSEDIKANTSSFIGDIQQYPPIFSALKKDGKRLYEYARKGEEVKIDPRSINISEFEITAINMPDIEFRVVCSKGTYIRSLANDFGAKLGVGAHLAKLRRTKIGELNVVEALSIEGFIEELKK
ncbi:MAG: tRNA pseudouridine(55) synthase TruB [Flavobacteriaceae bacterium]|nr:tRNA pseudouridine(55) synthase TruB [Flavobacteriaceae bacterium]